VEEYTDFWFWQVESAFEAAGVSADRKKYNTIIGQLPTRVMYKLADLKSHPPPTGSMYSSLKERIIREFSDSTQTRITKLLGDMSIGDRKPSQLLAEMRSKATETPVTEDLLRSLWLRNLPGQIRAILSTSEEVPLTQVATIADRVMEALQTNSSNVNTVQISENQLADPIKKVQAQIEEIFRYLKKNQRSCSWNGPNKKRSNPSTYQDNRDQRFDTCWWHFKFGSNARKCKSPCNFKEKN